MGILPFNYMLTEICSLLCCIF